MMKYEKPMIISLNDRARYAQGMGPLSCVGGSAASSSDETCASGNSAGWACSEGYSVVMGLGVCSEGNAPGDTNDCLAGFSANAGYCSGGYSGTVDLNGCRSGPTP